MRPLDEKAHHQRQSHENQGEGKEMEHPFAVIEIDIRSTSFHDLAANIKEEVAIPSHVGIAIAWK